MFDGMYAYFLGCPLSEIDNVMIDGHISEQCAEKMSKVPLDDELDELLEELLNDSEN